MRYSLNQGAERKKSRWPVVLSVLLLVGGVYMLLNTLSPVLPDPTADPQATVKKLQTKEPVITENRIYMPQINVDVPIVDINGNEELALTKGAIHRAPQSGNPKDGGNYVIAAHRFSMGITPAQTRQLSPFYHMDQMKVDDQIYVDYDGVRYAYKITEKKRVSASSIEIEYRTDKPRLTIYTCTLSGSNDGREVLFAEPIGTVTWSDGKPVIKQQTY